MRDRAPQAERGTQDSNLESPVLETGDSDTRTACVEAGIADTESRRGAARGAVSTGSVVYFVQGIGGGPIKIGYSATREGVGRRLASLQCGSATKLVVRHVIDGDRVDEHELHQRFARYRLEGEWFAPADEVAHVAHAVKLKARDPMRHVLRWVERAYEAGRERGFYDGESEVTDRFRRELARFTDAWSLPTEAEHLETLRRHAAEYAELRTRIERRAAGAALLAADAERAGKPCS